MGNPIASAAAAANPGVIAGAGPGRAKDTPAEGTAETFNYGVVRGFAIMTVVWGIVGMLVGVIIAAQLLWPDAQRTGLRGCPTGACVRCTPTR